MTDIGGAPAAGGEGAPATGGEGGAAPAAEAPRQVVPPAGQFDHGAADPEPAKAAAKYKTKRGGADAEHTGEELAAMAHDDYQHEYTGPGGKMTKANRADLIRRAQMGDGAQARIQAAAAREKKLDDREAWGKDPKNLPAYLEQLGIEDHEVWALEVTRAAYERDSQIATLQESDPIEAERRRQELSNNRTTRRDSYAKQQAEKEAAAKEAATAQSDARRTAQDAFKEVNLPWNGITTKLAREVAAEYRQAGVPTTDAVIAAEARNRYRRAGRVELEAMTDDDLVDYYGEPLRERMRGIESTLARGGKKAAKAAAAAADPPPPTADPPTGLTERELRQWQEADQKRRGVK